MFQNIIFTKDFTTLNLCNGSSRIYAMYKVMHEMNKDLLNFILIERVEKLVEHQNIQMKLNITKKILNQINL